MKKFILGLFLSHTIFIIFSMYFKSSLINSLVVYVIQNNIYIAAAYVSSFRQSSSLMRFFMIVQLGMTVSASCAMLFLSIIVSDGPVDFNGQTEYVYLGAISLPSIISGILIFTTQMLSNQNKYSIKNYESDLLLNAKNWFISFSYLTSGLLIIFVILPLHASSYSYLLLGVIKLFADIGVFFLNKQFDSLANLFKVNFTSLNNKK